MCFISAVYIQADFFFSFPRPLLVSLQGSSSQGFLPNTLLIVPKTGGLFNVDTSLQLQVPWGTKAVSVHHCCHFSSHHMVALLSTGPVHPSGCVLLQVQNLTSATVSLDGLQGHYFDGLHV